MSEFKFSCPNCNQNIAATSEYSGQQISCPSCQTLLVVPADPNAPAPAPTGSRLSMAPSTPHEQASAGAAAASSLYAAKPVKKKKNKTGLIVGLSLGACAVAAAIYFWPTLMDKLKHNDQMVAAAEAATNAPPPPPPPLTTEEILQKVGETYKGMTDYAAKAKTDCSLDMSALMPGKAVVNITTASSLQLGRTNNYRLEWEQNAAGKTTKGAAWSAGRGNFVGYGPYPPGKVKTREDALMPAAANFFLLSGGIADLFFADTNSMAADAKAFTKTNGHSLDGHETYVLAGEANHQSVQVWVDKNTFLISAIEVDLGGTIPPEELKKLPSAQRNALITLSKLKGTITETYDNIQTNQNLVASVFESPYQPNANPTAQPARQPRASSMAGQLTNPRRQRGP